MSISVGISDWKIARSPETLVTYALGSCVGICIWDKSAKIGGLSHIMLPDSLSNSGASLNRMKFADTAIPDMYNEMLRKYSCTPANLVVKIAGGALMFPQSNAKFNIGYRNVAAVRLALLKLRMPVKGADTGADYGRTVFFYPESGKIEVKASAQGTRLL